MIPRRVDGFRGIDRMVMVIEGCISINGQSIKPVSIILWKLKMHKDTPLCSYIIGWMSLIFGSVTLNDWAIIIGMFATIFGLIVTCLYRHLEYKLRKKQIEKTVDDKK